MHKPFRQEVRDRYQRLLEREAYRVTRRMVKRGIRNGESQLTVKIAGMRRQWAYMQVGWSPDTETSAVSHQGKPLGHTLLTLHLDVPDLPW